MTGRKSKSSKQPNLFTKDNPLCYGQLKFFVGAKIEALDSKKWYQARIVNINESSYRVLVHFEGWNSRHDKWFDYQSDFLRPLSSGDQKQQHSPGRKELQPGDKVLARWSDSKYYPAKISSAVNENSYEVIFFDGFKKRLNKSCIRPDPKRTFESFEAKYKNASFPGMPRGPSSSAPTTPAEVSSTDSNSRTKRRHAEPTTMADFVTTLPGKRPKQRHLGTPSDSDECSGFYESWDRKSKGSDAESQDIPGRHVQKKLGTAVYPTSPKAVSPLKSSPGEHTSEGPSPSTSSSPEQLKYRKKCYRKKMLAGDFLRIKLTSTSQEKKRRRNRSISDYIRDDGDNCNNGHVGNQMKSDDYMEGSTIEGPEETLAVKDERLEDVNIEKIESNEIYVSPYKDQGKESREKLPRKLTEVKHSSSEKVVLKRPRGRPRKNKDERRSEPPRVSDMSSKTSDNSSKTFDNQVRLPKRERKLTEKGFELLQSIGGKRGTEGLLKESFFSHEVSDEPKATSNTDVGSLPVQLKEKSEKVPMDEPNEKEITSLMVRISPLKVDRIPAESAKGKRLSTSEKTAPILNLEREIDKIDNPSTNIKEELTSELKIRPDSDEERLSPRRSSFVGDEDGVDLSIIKEQGRQPAKVARDLKKTECIDQQNDGVDEQASLISEEAETSKDDYNDDTYSEGSGSLVIDIDDEVKENNSAEMEQDLSNTEGQNEEKTTNLAEKELSSKPRAFAKLKYTLSHEERRGNRLARLKKIRSRRKNKRENKMEAKKCEKELQNVAGSVSSPLESLTRMVTEQSESAGLKTDATVATNSQETSPVQTEEGNTDVKPAKSAKQTRAPYKSRMKTDDSFLSMVQQDRPSQIERPVCSDLVKERLARGRPRSRNLNKQEGGYNDGTWKLDEHRKDFVERKQDLNEPLDFTSSSQDHNQSKSIESTKTVLLSSAPLPIQSLEGNYGTPQFMSYTGPQTTLLGQQPRHILPNQVLSYQSVSPEVAAQPVGPVIKSEPLSLDLVRAPVVSGKTPYGGMLRIPGKQGPLLEYSMPMQPMIHPNFVPPPVPVQFGPECVRFQGPDIQGPAQYPTNVKDCPCEECRNFSSRPMDIRMEKMEGEVKSSVCSTSKCTFSLGEADSDGSRSSPIATSQTKEDKADKELIITGVFSLRDTGMADVINMNKKGSSGKNEVLVESERSPESSPNTGNLNTNVTDDVNDGIVKAVDKLKESEDVVENTQITPKPKEFETKKKRLDLITGKLSAQKQSCKPQNDHCHSRETPGKESTSEGADSTAEARNTDAGEGFLKEKEKETMTSSIALDSHYLRAQTSTDYVLQPTRLVPSVNPQFDSQPGIIIEGSLPRAISPDGHVCTTYPRPVLQMEPRAYYQNPESIQQVQQIYNQRGLPPGAFPPPPPGVPFFGYPRYQSVPPYPYAPPRYVPAPGYYIPRDSLQNIGSRLPPPYAGFPMSSPNQRFVPIAPNERFPSVICKTPNCNCHLPHAAPPIQIAPKPSQPEALDSEDVDDIAKSKALQTPTVTQAAPIATESARKKKEALMKGDPRRLTLPLQRMKKVGVKLDSRNGSKCAEKPRKSSSTTSGSGEVKTSDEKEIALKQGGLEKTGSKDIIDDVSKMDEDGKENYEKQPEENDSKETENHEEPMEKEQLFRKAEKGKEKILAPKEFVVELDLNEFQCQFKGCKKSFRKASSRDYHQRYFHSPRVPQKKRKLSSCLPSPITGDPLLSPGNSSFQMSKSQRKISTTDGDAKTPEDLASIRSGYTSSVMTDDNASDREKRDESSSDDSDESDIDSDDSACVDDIIRCTCGDLEEQGFMIQCEQCFTWQHGDCVNLSVQTVPKKYLCYVCTNPKGLRSSYKYKNNYDWFKRGELPSLLDEEDEKHIKIANIMQASHALMEDIANIFDVIAGIRKKVALLNEPCHPSLRFWKSNDKESSRENVNCKPIDCLDIISATEHLETIVSEQRRGTGDDMEKDKELRSVDNQKEKENETNSIDCKNDRENLNNVAKDVPKENGTISEAKAEDPRVSSVDNVSKSRPLECTLESDKESNVNECAESKRQEAKLEDKGVTKTDNASAPKPLERTAESEKETKINDFSENKELQDGSKQPDISVNENVSKLRPLEIPSVSGKETKLSRFPENKEQEAKPKGPEISKMEKVPTSKPPEGTPESGKASKVEKFGENKEFEAVYAKLNLLDHLDSIEDELNQRMDVIEANLDVLEEKYKEAECESNGVDARSAFKVALPDMTSIARHLNMINRQLIDAN